MENRYQKMTDHIRPPEELDRRVLAAARDAAVPQRTRRPARRWVRAAVCAACALALVLGTWRLSPGAESETDGAALPAFSFGLTAYAADTGEYAPSNANGALAFRTGGEGGWTESGGYYTGCMFQVTGEDIASVSLSIDRGGLYRCRLRTDLTEAEIAQARRAMEEGTLAAAAITQEADGSWSMPEITSPETSVTEDYDPEASYGFWVPGVDAERWQADLREASHESIDYLDGARLTVCVTFSDGSTQSKTYTLSTGRLRYAPDGDGPGGTLLPQLAGDDESYVYGVYAESESEGRYFLWPVPGASTISLSNPYGEGENGTFHAGIDIPAPAGTAVLAAADGTVAEIGFDSERGNYIVLDHDGGLTTLYGQCREIAEGLTEGDAVSAGETVAVLGATGMATGAHLHFEVRLDGEPQDPVAYFDSAVRDTLRMG